MKNVGKLLATQRQMERDFVAEVTAETTTPKGWTAALTMFHLARWRGRLLHAMTEHTEGRPFVPPARNVDELNDAELQNGAQVSLADASADSDRTLGALIELWTRHGDRPMDWFMARSTAEVLIRNSYYHPRIHLAGYFRDRGDNERANQIVEQTASELRRAQATPQILGAALCNLAGVRIRQGRLDEALVLLEEGLPMRTDLAAAIATDRDFASVRDLPRFRKLVRQVLSAESA